MEQDWIRMTDMERRQYEHSLKVYRDNYAISKTDQKIGQEREKISVIRKLFNSGDSLDHISEITDKSIDQIKRILKLK